MQSTYGGYARVEKSRDGWLPCLKLKGKGRLDLGEYPTDRLAAVAHDIARLMLIREMRPASDLHADKGTHFHPDAYLSDRIFKNLCAENTSFEDVCDLLRSGVLAEQFVCAHDRHTRHTRSLSSGSAGSRQRPGTAAAAAAAAQAPTKQQQQEEQEEPEEKQRQHAQQQQQQQQQQAQQEQQQQQQAQQEEQQQQQRAQVSAATLGVATAKLDAARLQKKADSVSPGSRLPMRWVEWPTKGDGQFLSCISEDALEAGMTLPSRMKRELFQTTGASAQIAAHDLSAGSTLRWTWEVRDCAKETCVHNLGPFLAHFKARAGDVLVVVAAAPGAVKATVWRGDSADAAQFKASLQKGRSRHAGGPASGGRGSKKRPADTLQQPRQQVGPSKAAKAATPPSSSLQAATAPVHVDCSTGAKQAQQEGTQQQQQQRTLQLPSPPVLPQPQAHVLSSELLAVAGLELYGCQPSTCDNDGQQQSPTGQVAQSPYRQQLLPPLACAAVKVKHEQQIAALPGVEGVPVAAGVDETAAGGSGAGIAAAAALGAPLSPARVSYADASPALMQQLYHQQQQQQQQQAPAGPLPDPLAIVGDDNAVFYEMSRLLVLIAGTGCVPGEAVSTYRRSFACLEPAGRRFFHFESLKTFYDAADWGQIQQWLQAA